MSKLLKQKRTIRRNRKTGCFCVRIRHMCQMFRRECRNQRIKVCRFFAGQTSFGKMYCMFFIMTHGLASRDRNASCCAFAPQSQPDPFRNRSTAITSRCGRLVSERPDPVGQVLTRAPGAFRCIPAPKLWCEHGLIRLIIMPWQQFDSSLTAVWQQFDSSLTAVWQQFDSSLTAVWQQFDSSLTAVWQQFMAGWNETIEVATKKKAFSSSHHGSVIKEHRIHWWHTVVCITIRIIIILAMYVLTQLRSMMISTSDTGRVCHW